MTRVARNVYSVKGATAGTALSALHHRGHNNEAQRLCQGPKLARRRPLRTALHWLATDPKLADALGAGIGVVLVVLIWISL